MEKDNGNIYKVEVVKQSTTCSDPGGAIGFIFGTYAVMCWLSMGGLISPDATLTIGIFQFLYAIGFLASSVLNTQKGNPFGAVNLVFTVAFGFVGGANQVCAVLLPEFDLPYDGAVGSIFFLISGIYLLFIMPGMLWIPKYLFITYLSGAVGLILAGVGGTAVIPWMNTASGWVFLITAAGGIYSSIASTNAGLGLNWPPEGTGFKNRK